jgi:drug/metabolite transporter (DMT)-like permease
VQTFGAYACNLYKAVVGMLLLWLLALAFLPLGSFERCSLTDIALLLASGAVGMAVGDYFYFAAIQRVGVRQASLLHATNPLFLLLWSLSFASGDSLHLVEIAGVLLVVGGVVDVTRRREPAVLGIKRHFASGVVFGLAAALGQAIGLLIAKGPVDTCHPTFASAVRLTGAAGSLLLASLLTGRLHAGLRIFRNPDARRRSLEPVFLGTFLGIACMTIAISSAKPAVAGALLSLTPVFVIPVSRWLLLEPIRPATLIGTCIAVSGVVLLAISS